MIDTKCNVFEDYVTWSSLFERQVRTTCPEHGRGGAGQQDLEAEKDGEVFCE